MATLVTGYLFVISELSSGLLLMREPNPTRADCDTAWTIGVLQGVVVGAGLVLLAPLAARYFSEPRLELVMYILAASPVIDRFENIGVVLVRKDLDFARDFRINLYKRIGGVTLTICLAFVFRNYWALVYGQIGSSVLGVLVSFIMHPYRPRFSLAKARRYVRFAFATIPMGLATYTSDRMSVLVGGRIGLATDLGRLTVASEIGTMATEEIASPVERALFPSMSKFASDRNQLAKVFVNTLGAITFLTVPVGLGLSSVASDFIAVLLGQKWIGCCTAISDVCGLRHCQDTESYCDSQYCHCLRE